MRQEKVNTAQLIQECPVEAMVSLFFDRQFSLTETELLLLSQVARRVVELHIIRSWAYFMGETK